MEVNELGEDLESRRQKTVRETEALTRIFSVLNELDEDAKRNIIRTLVTFYRTVVEESTASLGPISRALSSKDVASFSEDRTMTAKQFLLDKSPKTDVERVACLAYYLTHFLNTPHFKTLDISKLNTEAAQIKFSNPAVTVDNASKLGYLAPASKGNKQITAIGELYVQALPDREAARLASSNARPRRRARKTTKE